MNATLTTATTTITANEIQMGIEHYKQVIAEWDEAVEETTFAIATDADVAAAQERVIKMFAEINAMTAKEVAKPAERKMSSIEASMPAWMLTGRTGNGTFSGRGTAEPAVKKTAEPATQAEPATHTYMILPGESRPFIHTIADVDYPKYGLKAEQVFYLVRSTSLSECAEQPVYHIVKWSYEQCRWVCPCLAVAHQCKHVRAVNQDCHNRAQQQSTVELQKAA